MKVLVLDRHRGIYYGELIQKNLKDRWVKLSGLRHCFRYPAKAAGEKGVYSLASSGPGPGAKVGPACNGYVLDVAKIIFCTPAAVVAWEEATWE